jgi:dTDP-glucose 4,6-dehydratase
MNGPVLVTGGLGFIGSAFVRRIAGLGVEVVNLDVGTYAGDARRLTGVALETHRLDVADPEVTEIVRRLRPAVIVHFAAESHVTRSEREGSVFWRTNVEGTRRVLDAAVAAGTPTVLHISTDEVYGPCHGEPFRETDKVLGEGLATSAYARSKALADDLAMSYSDRLDIVLARPTNCYGPWQHPEKAIARWTTRALRGEPIPVWGDGAQIRDWMHVDDAVEAFMTLVRSGRSGHAYNIAPEGASVSNLEMATLVTECAGADESLVQLTAYDRPQHDRRYAIDAARLRALGWRASVDLPDGIASTVDWYRGNRGWWGTLVADAESLYVDV